jgi:hypothetical protein
VKVDRVVSRYRGAKLLRALLSPWSLLLITGLAPVLLSGCAGLVSGSTNTNNTTPTSLQITNVQVASATTSTCQIAWTTNVPADSAVDYGVTSSYGASTPVDSTMATTHQVTVSGLAAGTTYYYQVLSTDSSSNHGKSGGHNFKTLGFAISGAISPATGGSGATLTLSGSANATTTADGSGNYTFGGLPNGTYMVVPNHAGYTFTPSSQNVTLNGGNSSGVNFTGAAQTYTISGTISPTAGASGATVTLSGAGSGATTANASGAYTFTGLVSGSYSVTPSNTGYVFSPVIQNVTVSSANVTGVNFTDSSAAVAPTITTPPLSQTATAGQTATFTVVATGTAPLGYQWQKNGVNISGATGASYTTPITTTSDSGSTFDVIVTNSAGAATSGAAMLTVNVAAVAPTITTQPANQTVTAGQAATFTVVATGTAPLSYQWQKSGVNILGATSSSYTTPATATSDTGSTFAVVVSNTAGAVTSAAATLTVNPASAPAIQVSPTTINFGNAVVGTNLSQALVIKNTGTATLTISQVSAAGSGFSVSGFSLPFNVNAGQQTTITIAFLPTVIGSTSGNISIASNAPASPTSVALIGTGIVATFTLGISPTALSFGNVTTGTSSAGQNIVISDTGNSNLTISQITLSGTGYVMTGGSAPVTLSPSQSVTLTVQFSPAIAGTANGSVSIVSNATGSPASVSLAGTGVAPTQHSVALSWGASPSTVVGYNLYRSTVSGSLFARVNGATVASLAYTDTSVQSGTTYYYVATAVDAAGNESVFSNQVQAIVP